MKVWITKYALTNGITEANGTLNDTGSMFSYGQWGHAHGEGKDWHRTKEGALARAEQMRVAKIALLRKSILKMEKLRFE